MYLELKDVEAAQDLSTVYNDVLNVDNITIQPVSKNDIKISLQGEDISSSKVYFTEENAVPLPPENPAVSDTEESIELSKPINAYTPVYNPKQYAAEIDQTSNPKVNSVLSSMNIDRTAVVNTKGMLKKIFSKTSNSNILVVLGILAIAGAIMFRPGKKSGNASGMHSLRDINREVELNRGMNPAVYKNRPAANYGMRAYQQSQKNPYMTNDLAQHRAGVSGIPRRNTAAAGTTAAPKPSTSAMKIPVAAQNTAPVMSGMTNTVNAGNVDGAKFLESITKIYEKNGREDLAKGLKDNLKKCMNRTSGIEGKSLSQLVR
jgi:hypothetical protein